MDASGFKPSLNVEDHRGRRDALFDLMTAADISALPNALQPYATGPRGGMSSDAGLNDTGARNLTLMDLMMPRSGFKLPQLPYPFNE